MTGALAIAEALLRQHEGYSQTPYQCTAGKLTIGFGRNLEARGIRMDEALIMLANDIQECASDLAGFDYWNGLNDNQQAALIDLRFCVGPAGYRGFKKMNAALEQGDIPEAARQVLDSKFANQTGGRAQDIADLLLMPGQEV